MLKVELDRLSFLSFIFSLGQCDLLLSHLYTVALGQNFPVVVMFSSSDSAEIEKWIEKPPIAINQMVFFLSLDDMQVFETYQVT